MASALLQHNDVVQVNMVCRVDGQLCMNTFHYWVDPTASPGTAQTVAQALTAWETKVWQESVAGARDGMTSLMFNNAENAIATGQIIVGPGSRSRLELYVLSPDGGTYPTGNETTSGVSAVCKRTGAMAGRKFQGRIYLPAVPAAACNASLLTDAYMTFFRLWATRQDTPLTLGAGGTLVTLRSCLITGLTAPAPGQIDLQYDPTNVVRYQRRREVGVGI